MQTKEAQIYLQHFFSYVYFLLYITYFVELELWSRKVMVDIINLGYQPDVYVYSLPFGIPHIQTHSTSFINQKLMEILSDSFGQQD